MNWSDEHSAICDAMNRSVGVIDWFPRTLIQLTGRDRVKFVHNLSTANIQSLAPGSGTEAFFCNASGKIQGFVFVFCHEDHLWIETSAGQASSLLPHLDKYLITEDVQITDCTDDWRQFLVVGPGARGFLGSLGCPLESSGSVPYLDHFAIDWNGLVPAGGQPPGPQAVDAVGDRRPGGSIRNLGRGAESLWLVQFPAAWHQQLVRDWSRQGAVFGDERVREVVRIEHGIPEYGKDIDSTHLPQEVDRDTSAISFTKGCYLGQETVARIDALGHVNWRLARIQLGDGDLTFDQVPPVGAVVQWEGQVVGQLTSATWSPGRKAPIAWARIRHQALSQVESADGSSDDRFAVVVGQGDRDLVARLLPTDRE